MIAGLALLVAIALGALTAADAGQSSPLAPEAPPEAVMRPRQPPGQTLPLAPTRHLHFTTSSGTWLSLDVEPRGGVVFDLLGDLYTISAAGGKARAITSGLAFDTQPAVSPNGRWIAFVSDRSGADNLWLVRPDGSGARQISFGDDDTVLVSPGWAADGQSLFVSRYRADLNGYELWRYGLDGHERLVVPVRATTSAPRSTWRSSLGAVASPDGRSVYFARHVGPLEFDDPVEWTIVRHDLATDSETMVVAEPDGPRKALNPGAAFRPMLSPDGRQLAYARRTANATELRLRDLATGQDRQLAFPIEHDQLQASMWQDIVPRYAFTRDGRSVVLARGGGFVRIALNDGAVTPIPFTAAVDLALGPTTKQQIREDNGPVVARLIMAPVASPDGRTLAFSALGRLWLMPLDGHSLPALVVTSSDPAFQPSWSPDGRRLTWVTWSERNGGAVWAALADGTSPPVRISKVAAFYTYPVFTPDGTRVVAVRSAQAARSRLYMEYGRRRDADLVMWQAAGGPEHVVAHGTIGGRPHFSGDAAQVYLLGSDGLTAIDLASGSMRVVVQVTGPGWYFQDGVVPVDDLRLSPDGKWLLAQVAQQLHLVALPPAGTAGVDLTAPSVAHRRLTASGADYFEWADGGRTITWSSGSTFHRLRLADVGLDPPDVAGWTADSATNEAFHALLSVPRDRGSGSLLLSGARVLTMADGDRILPNADILVTDGHIAAVGRHGSIAAPAGTVIRDVGGKTIVPGFIDTHDHIAEVRRDVLGLDDWGLRARLASGVTTSFDPSTLTVDMLAYQDLLDAGLMLGPRIRQTGIALFSMQRFASLDEVRAVLRRYRDDYGLRNIKEYRTGNRRVRQWIAIAAHELGLQPTTEGALAMKLDLTQIIDGFADNEHALVAAPLSEDVVSLMTGTRTGYTTTLQITNGGPPGEDWFIATTAPRDDRRLTQAWPPVALDQMTLSRPWRPLSEYRFPAIAADAALLQRRGGLVGMGSHGEMPGIGFQWELMAHVIGGMTPMEALHAGTIGSAEHIGRAADLGSIVPGKRADLVVLDRDPTHDIAAIVHPSAVMRDGRLYDAATLDELWPSPRAASLPWFATTDRQYLPAGVHP